MPFIPTEEEADYVSCSDRMLLRLRHSILDADNLKNLILPKVDQFGFDYLFPPAWISARCEHFRESLNFEHRF